MNTTKKILLIDDDTDDQEFFLEAAHEVDSDIECSFASSCEEALDLLKSKSFSPTHIFLDLNMPKLDGKKCLAEIKKIAHLKNTPVIIYSTSSLKRDIEETRALGAIHFLTKPSAFQELCAAISNILALKFYSE